MTLTRLEKILDDSDSKGLWLWLDKNDSDTSLEEILKGTALLHVMEKNLGEFSLQKKETPATKKETTTTNWNSNNKSIHACKTRI